jgi:non-specific serine/threonine protein kinase
MPILTIENLDPATFHFYDYNTMTQGRLFFQEGRCSVLTFDGQSATCRVRDNRADYIVTVTAESKRQTAASCDCPQSGLKRMCKHIIASLLCLREHVQQNAQNQWQYRVMQAIENTPKAKARGRAKTKYAIVFGLLREQYAYGGVSYRLVPWRIKAQDWPGIKDLEEIPDQAGKNEMLDKNRGWTRSAEVVSAVMDYQSVVNLPTEGIYLYNLLQKSSSYYYGVSDYTPFLPVMAKVNAPVFLMNARNSFKERVQMIEEPARVEAALSREGENYSIQAGINVNGKIYTTIKGNLHILSSDPAWVLAGQYIAPVENPEALTLMEYLPLTIPAKDEEEFREKYLHSFVERIPLQGDIVSWTDVDCEPIPRLYLRDDEGKLRASLRFGYADHELEANPKAAPLAIIDLPGSWGVVRVHRHSEQEDNFYQLLTDTRFGLKRSTVTPTPGIFELRARTHPLDFLMHSIPLLTVAGFEIFGEESLKSGRLNRNKPTISLNITSGIDWFDIDAVVHYGDQEVSLKDLRSALRKKERFIKLADGSIGQIPEEWMQRYKRLFDLAEETDERLRVRDYHLPLVDTLLNDADERNIAAEYKERMGRLSGFAQIQPQSIPRGFVGELRPYQRAGLDWLHFLHEYGFGGCLADDMGLGKTIQALAFLQALKEQGKLDGPSLLVVPKSLIANWEREAERFTPELRILEYVGAGRPKDTSAFAGYDIVLTTYGTMLRDIELLQGCSFLYAILDESQNIKNPLSQSSKAARLLNARHRLVMTGTPVENNTFELWSQFTFLNPGLLGSMEYFKREFATPIESHESDEAANLLRRLVYPFILRRTKEQVAPELPERNERILYIDFDPAQRKIYNHTREYYRGLLMGMIDEQGIDDVRMKILEGLLRLRQICIHPALVESTYRGESAKFELLLETLDTLQAEGHRALVFSQFVQTLHLLRHELEARQIRYTYLDGQTADRQQQVDRFQGDPTIPFFLISLKAGGVGLNLTAADYVIHIDPWWNPAVEMQAADRAHRIGQDKPVFIYKIIARNSVEEKILQLQEHKKDLVNQLISAEGSFFKSITKEDVKVLFS